jgi:hypothetical protein
MPSSPPCESSQLPPSQPRASPPPLRQHTPSPTPTSQLPSRPQTPFSHEDGEAEGWDTSRYSWKQPRRRIATSLQPLQFAALPAPVPGIIIPPLTRARQTSAVLKTDEPTSGEEDSMTDGSAMTKAKLEPPKVRLLLPYGRWTEQYNLPERHDKIAGSMELIDHDLQFWMSHVLRANALRTTSALIHRESTLLNPSSGLEANVATMAPRRVAPCVCRMCAGQLPWRTRGHEAVSRDDVRTVSAAT